MGLQGTQWSGGRAKLFPLAYGRRRPLSGDCGITHRSCALVTGVVATMRVSARRVLIRRQIVSYSAQMVVHYTPFAIFSACIGFHRYWISTGAETAWKSLGYTWHFRIRSKELGKVLASSPTTVFPGVGFTIGFTHVKSIDRVSA
jgi:hypothetical protein